MKGLKRKLGDSVEISREAVAQAKMEFCDVCNNMLYIKSAEDFTLIKHCRHCSFKKEISPTTGTAIRISKTMYSEDDLLYMQHQSKFLRYDPTLPRVQDGSIVCPNKDCKGSKEKPNVSYVKYHPVDMKYFYCCNVCGETWRTEE
jgi:DNA-directed RNA polymerase subunit M/transcription elongation factor TFIIS